MESLVEELTKLPGVGRKTAERYALYIINKMDNEQALELSNSIEKAKISIKRCSKCGNLTDNDICDICLDFKRDQSIILVVENPKDVFSIEKSNEFNGLYHVLHGALSPINGIGPEELNLENLWERITDDKVKEVIIATSSTPEGETTALYIKRVLENLDILVTRIGYGVPVGLNLEYADDLTLSKAIENRKKI